MKALREARSREDQRRIAETLDTALKRLSEQGKGPEGSRPK